MPLIHVRQLTRRFDDLVAVDQLSFDVSPGEIFALLGPNGAGKTTTIQMLTTLLRPSGGIVRVNGFDPIKESHEVRRSFGIVFQDSSLDIELTAYENLNVHGVLYHVPRRIRAARIEYLLRCSSSGTAATRW